MRLTRRAALGGIQLDQADQAIVIRGINPGVPHETMNAVSMMGGAGQRLTVQHWDWLEASVTFAIDLPKRQLAERRAVFDKAIAWAMRKGWLTMTPMSGKRMFVDKVVVPGSGDLWEWLNDYTIIFRAYAVPFWQDSTKTETEIAAADSGAGSITVPGTADTVCDAEILNAGNETIDDLNIRVGGSVMTFEDLGLEAGEALVVSHGNDGLVSIRIRTG